MIFNQMRAYFTRITLLISALFFISDIVGDIKEGEGLFHLLGESTIFILICVALFLELIRSQKLNTQVHIYETELQALKGELADVVKAQFSKWHLSKAESEVAWLVLKGFSYSEISKIRSVSERTIRQQAGTAYKKSNNKNRSEFTACFLDDFLNDGVAETA